MEQVRITPINYCGYILDIALIIVFSVELGMDLWHNLCTLVWQGFCLLIL